MFIVIGVIVLGVFVGILFRSRIKQTVISKFMSAVICLLLLILGIMVGSNEHLVNNLSTLGLKALLISLGAIIGSVMMAFAIERLLFRKDIKKGGNER